MSKVNQKHSVNMSSYTPPREFTHDEKKVLLHPEIREVVSGLSDNVRSRIEAQLNSLGVRIDNHEANELVSAIQSLAPEKIDTKEGKIILNILHTAENTMYQKK